MALALMTSVGSFAKPILEFDETQEIKCFSEAQALGCVTSAGEENVSCIEANKVKLTKECQNIHFAKMNNK